MPGIPLTVVFPSTPRASISSFSTLESSQWCHWCGGGAQVGVPGSGTGRVGYPGYGVVRGRAWCGTPPWYGSGAVSPLHPHCILHCGYTGPTVSSTVATLASLYCTGPLYWPHCTPLWQHCTPRWHPTVATLDSTVAPTGLHGDTTGLHGGFPARLGLTPWRFSRSTDLCSLRLWIRPWSKTPFRLEMT